MFSYLRTRRGLGIVAAVVVAVGAGLYFGFSPSRDGADDDPATPIGKWSVRVATIRPKKDANFSLSIDQLAGVRALYQAELKSRVAGVVKAVNCDIGDAVKKGDVLIEVDVPDLAQDVAQKTAVVEQRRQEMRLSEAKVKSSRAWIETATANVAQQKAAIVQAEATASYRKLRLDRYRELLKQKAINDDLVDEQERDYNAAVGAVQSAVAGVQKAEADLKERKTELETALVDVDLKKSQIDVANRDLDRTRVLADLATITAPFDGVILKRLVDPGDFVQNASTGSGQTLIAAARVDVVTVVSKVPDNAAGFVRRDTPVEIRIDQFPAMVFKSKVTRFSPSIDDADRTMRVEIDIRNSPAPRAEASTGSKAKSASIDASGESLADRPLFPGMNGYVRFKLDEIAGALLVPSTAIINRGGKPFVVLAEEGKARIVPVFVQVNDGKMAKIALVRHDSTGREVRVELTGHEEFVASRQAELKDGQPIQTNLKKW